MSWSGMRSKLENEYLAASLRGHIQYYATSYNKCPDHEGRAAIRFDGKEEMAFMDDTAVRLGVFDQRSFYEAFSIFDNQSIEESLSSENMLVRIFAILDRRVGKRRLEKIRRGIEGEEKTFREFFAIRAAAEGLRAERGEEE